MMKKLIVLLGIIVLLFGLVALLVPDNQSAIAADKDRDNCYLVCMEFCPPIVCGTSNICLWWMEHCPGDRSPTKK